MIMDKECKISVITVCYNCVSVIEQTIKSVLEQTYPNIEYIIIDGGSTDGTVDIIKRYSDRVNYWISEPDKGIYDAMNKGINRATGKWIHFRNSGDLFFSPYSISNIFKESIDENTVIIHGDCKFTFKDKSLILNPPGIEKYEKIMPFFHPSMFVKTSFHKNNLFDSSLRSSADYKFVYQSLKKGIKTQYIPIPVSIYDSREGMSVNNWQIARKEIWKWRNGDSLLSKIKMNIDIISIKITKALLNLRNNIYGSKN